MFYIISSLLCVPPLIICLIFLARFFLYSSSLIYVFRKWIEWVEDRIHIHQYFTVPEFEPTNHRRKNQLYRRVSLYLNSLQSSLEDSDFTNLVSGKKPNEILLSLDENQAVKDTFLGARVSWVNRIDGGEDSRRSFVLRIKKKDKRRILNAYLQHIHTAVAGDMGNRAAALKIHYNAGDGKWRHAPFDHPACFDALVMDADLKSKIKSDLEAFLKSEQYYHRLGRVWRRSYLLYGPSGTGKSSFIAAAANFLGYDVHSLNLSQVADDAQLITLLLQISGKSIVVVEDLDSHLSEKMNKVSTAGLLNFMDGILNLQDETITIFTMNSKDGVKDSALLRPGRIDMHIHFPLCDFKSFKDLASNYLGVTEHKLFTQVEEIFQRGATMSQSEIGELMLVNRSSPSRALKSVITALQSNDGRREEKTVSRRMFDTASSAPSPAVSSGDNGGDWKEAVPKEFRKLYGLLRLKSCRRMSGSFDHDDDVIQRS